MKVAAILHLLLIFFQLCLSYKQITTRISPRSVSKQRLFISFSDETTTALSNLVFNSVPIATLAVFLFFQDKGLKDKQDALEKNLVNKLEDSIECFEEKVLTELKVLDGSLAAKDEALKNDLLRLNDLRDVKFEFYKLAANNAKPSDEVNDGDKKDP